MAVIEQETTVGKLKVSYGNVLLRTHIRSGDPTLDSLQNKTVREILVVYEVPIGNHRVLASAIGNIFPQGNRFSIPASQLNPDFFIILERDN